MLKLTPPTRKWDFRKKRDEILKIGVAYLHIVAICKLVISKKKY